MVEARRAVVSGIRFETLSAIQVSQLYPTCFCRGVSGDPDESAAERRSYRIDIDVLLVPGEVCVVG